MNTHLELWQFIADRLDRDQPVMLLTVAESSGSSPGRQGYKMAVAGDDELFGSIGGGVMEVNLVEQSRALMSEPPASAGGQFHLKAQLIEQVHQMNSPNASGMICSGKQTVIVRLLNPVDRDHVIAAARSVAAHKRYVVEITTQKFSVGPPEGGTPNFEFEKLNENEFVYRERLGPKNDLYIVGGGHCSLALSELMARLGFRITIFDDRPELNTIEKNRFAHEIRIIDAYEYIGDLIGPGTDTYVVVMTIGYASDEVAIRSLIFKPLKYLGVLGSRAKMAKLLQTL
ncbi:MAG: XdhC family protein, partial [Acidobacteriota bacterium]